MTIREFLISQAKRAGISQDDTDFNMMVGASALGEIQVPDSVVQKFNSGLFDMEVAKSSLDLKTHFLKSYLTGYDEEVVKMAKDYGLSNEAVEEIKLTKNSGDKVKVAFKHLKDLEESARKSTSKGQSEEYVAKLAEAQKKLDDAIAKAENEKREIEGRYVDKMKSLWEQAQLSGINWNKSIPEIARIPSYNAAKEAKLKSLNGIAYYDADKHDWSLKNATDPSLPLVVNGKEFSYSDLNALILQENKLLDESGGGGSSNKDRQGTITDTATKGGAGTITPRMRGMMAEIDSISDKIQSSY
jgi:hypothetical protein